MKENDEKRDGKETRVVFLQNVLNAAAGRKVHDFLARESTERTLMKCVCFGYMKTKVGGVLFV
jgi:hypothetical protein